MDEPATGFRQRRARILAVFLAASLVAHAAVLVVLPSFEWSSTPTRPAVLEVVILQPEPLPVAPPQPEPEQGAKPPPPRVAAKAPVLTLPEPEAQAESQFATPSPVSAPAPISEAPPAASEPKKQVASVAPPAFNAAYLRNPAPRYPVAARRAGEQGTVTLRVLVGRDGEPVRVELEKSSGSTHLDNAALETVKGWRFSPARRGAEPVEGWVLVPIVFRLEGSS